MPWPLGGVHVTNKGKVGKSATSDTHHLSSTEEQDLTYDIRRIYKLKEKSRFAGIKKVVILIWRENDSRYRKILSK